MERLDWTTRVNASLEAVSEFHNRPGAIRTLTPFVVPMSRHRVEPLTEGSIAEFTLWFGPLPVRWTAQHTDVDPLAGFTDTQISGPFKHWVHRHRFERDARGGSRIVENIEYAHFGDSRRLITRTLFSKPMLYLLFSYRSMALRWFLRKRPHRQAVLPSEQP